jgi:hypothetical protein
VLVAGEGTPTQAIILGLLWVAWFGTLAIWPRQSLRHFDRYRRWKGDEGSGWPVPMVREQPTEPTDRAVTLYRIATSAMALIGVVLTVTALARL